MKTQIKVFGAVAALVSTTAFATAGGLDGINSKIKGLLIAYNNPITKAKVVIESAEMNEQRATAVGGTMTYSKKGEISDLSVRLKAKYKFDDQKKNAQPMTKASLELKGSFVRQLIDQINAMSSDKNESLDSALDELFKSITESYTRDYSTAATVTTEFSNKNVDEKGNLTSITARVNARVNLAALPAAVPVETVQFTRLQLEIALDIKTGLKITLGLISNPQHSSFSKDEEGLKEIVAKIQNGDEKFLSEIAESVAGLDRMVKEAVNKKLGE